MTARGDPPVVRVEGLEVGYGAEPVLRGLSLGIARGEFVALVGPNGSGKSTLLRTLLGFLPPRRGRVEVLGRPVEELSIRDRARSLAWVPQSESPRDDVSVEQYVLYGRYAHQRAFEGESAEDRAIARTAIGEMDLADRASHGILSLSGGERQRAVLARALAQASPVLLLDEPTSQLDIGHQLDVLDRVRGLARRREVTVLAALHDLNLASRYADRVLVLSRGRLVANGSPDRVLSESLLAEVWGVEAELRRDPRTGTPYLLPRRALPVGPVPAGDERRGPIHVVGGGGAATPILYRLVEEGFRLTAGALHLLDSDAETCATLQVPAALEAPFAPLGDRVRAEHRALLDRAQAVVVAPFPVGASNRQNLEDVLEIAGRTPVLLFPRGPAEWDFTRDGSGRAAWVELRRRGAIEVANLDDLVRRLGSIVPAPPVGEGPVPPATGAAAGAS